MIGQRARLAIQRREITLLAGMASSTSKYIRHLSALIAASLLTSTVLHAATISYGNFGPIPPGVSFLDVKESSGTDAVPLYGTPDPVVVGLDFDPASFVATAAGGGADITDGQLNFTVMGNTAPGGPIVGISAISLTEGGDYSLVGTGTAASQVFAGAIISAKVVQIDGLPVAPINLNSNASVNFNLVANPGVVQPWLLGTSVNVDAALAGLGVPYRVGATKIEVAINNQLIAISEPASVAFIAKKDFVIGIIPKPGGEIPEPNTLALIGVAAALMGCVAKQRGRIAA